MNPRNVQNWKQYRSDPNIQTNGVDDEMDCVTWSALHDIEAIVNEDIANGNYQKEALTYFYEAGYLNKQTGLFECSDLFNAILNGTTHNGNNETSVDLSMLAVGLLPWSDLPLPDNEKWGQYMAKTNVTQVMKDKALKIFDYIHLSAHPIYGSITPQIVAQAPVQIAVSICAGWNTDTPVKACVAPSGHCVTLDGVLPDGSLQIFDTYEPFNKILAADYKIYGAMQYNATPVLPPNLLQKLIKLLLSLKINPTKAVQAVEGGRIVTS